VVTTSLCCEVVTFFIIFAAVISNKKNIRFPAEWEPQRAVQMTFPHAGTDWAPYLDEASACFAAIAREIAKREGLVIVCADEASVRRLLGSGIDYVSFYEMPTDDTWARDHGGITVFAGGKRIIYDFKFNGWGLKYPAGNDNLITSRLAVAGAFGSDAQLVDMQHFVLEGGSVESDGCGAVMTTSRCLLARHGDDACHDDEARLKEYFGADRVLWLHHGYLAGDDTDGHIDTLARFCDAETIAYVCCEDADDEHFTELKAMEEELRIFRTAKGAPYRLLPLPMADAVFYEGERLPATYANFLIINGAVLMPFYDSRKDAIAAEVLQQAFPDREIVGVDCRVLLRQHGSLHCVTMQMPEY